MKIEMDDVEKIETIETDSRGRVHLGPEYKDSRVKVVVVESEEKDA